MPSLSPPTPHRLRGLATRLAARPLGYRPGLLDRADREPALGSDLRHGWIVDRCSATIGEGAGDFGAACDALRSWQQFPAAWTVMLSPPAPINRGTVVTYAARALGLWWSYGCRILRVVDEPTRFGFVYGTLAGHAERGEELFLVEYLPGPDGAGDGGDHHRGDVVFSLFAMSRPGRWFAWPGLPIARRAQARFRSSAARAMRAAVDEARTAPTVAQAR